MRELFVYYRVPAERLDAARRLAEAFGRRLAERLPELDTRWLQRADDSGGAPTWMEHHTARTEAGVTPADQALIEAEAAELAALLPGGRHVEVFVVRRSASIG